MTLKEWIALVGDGEAARILKVKPRTARSWREGRRSPRPREGRRIADQLKGRVSFEEIYQ